MIISSCQLLFNLTWRVVIKQVYSIILWRKLSSKKDLDADIKCYRSPGFSGDGLNWTRFSEPNEWVRHYRISTGSESLYLWFFWEIVRGAMDKMQQLLEKWNLYFCTIRVFWVANHSLLPVLYLQFNFWIRTMAKLLPLNFNVCVVILLRAKISL
jgi:hypothetical protein